MALPEDTAARAIYVPIVYGSASQWLGKKAGTGESTHKWSVFVRHPDGLDLSYAISKVVFQLHSTFAEPTREVTSQPFEVSESGWGEFEVGMTIHLHDKLAEPIQVVHRLRLYPPQGVAPSMDRPVIDEVYDEIVFNTLPKDKHVLQRLLQGPQGKKSPLYPYHDYLGVFDAEDDLAKIQAARLAIEQERKALEERLYIRRLEAARSAEEAKALGVA